MATVLVLLCTVNGLIKMYLMKMQIGEILMGLFSKKINKEQMADVKRLLKQSHDCARISATTLNIGEFYEKYDEFENCLTDLIKYEKYRIFSNMLPSSNLKYIRENRVNDENALIRRTFQAVKKKADKAKTQDERNKMYTQYFESFKPFIGKMDSFNITQLEDLKNMIIPETE